MYTTLTDLPSSSKLTFTYAGIGSRKIPLSVCGTITALAEMLAKLHYTLHLNSDAPGADTAFAKGASRTFVPQDATEETRDIVREVYPNIEQYSVQILDLMARNTFQIFGQNLDTPVDFVLCWTPDGCESHNTRTDETGATGQAISIASLKNIPVINIANTHWQTKLLTAMNIF